MLHCLHMARACNMHMRVAPFGCHKRRDVAFGQSPVTSTCVAPRCSDTEGTKVVGADGGGGTRGTDDPGHRTWPLIGGLACGTIPKFPRETYRPLREKRDTGRTSDDTRAITRTEFGIVARKNSPVVRHRVRFKLPLATGGGLDQHDGLSQNRL